MQPDRGQAERPVAVAVGEEEKKKGRQPVQCSRAQRTGGDLL
jgi:hypothetical protein